jgi:hypothetical protein
MWLAGAIDVGWRKMGSVSFLFDRFYLLGMHVPRRVSLINGALLNPMML